MLTPAEIDRFCEEGESNRLDFKSEAYPFARATDHQKSELLKDVLAFANTRRSVPAYILCGIEKDDSGAMCIVGVSPDSVPDDASIQEFVRGKVNKELEFITYLVKCNDDKWVWVMEIPACVGERPYYVKNAFGKLPQYCVPIRQGSSTRFATPDDVYKMATDKVLVENTADFDVDVRTRPLVRDQVLVAFDFHSDMRRDDGTSHYAPSFGATNYEKYRRLRDWLSRIPIQVDLTNTSAVCAEDISVKVSIESADNIAQISEDVVTSPWAGGSVRDMLESVSAAEMSKTLCAGDSRKDVKTVYMIADAGGEATIVVSVFCKQLKTPVVRRFPVRIVRAKLEISAYYVNLITSLTNCASKYARFLSCLIGACNEVSHIDHLDWAKVVHESVHTLMSEGEDGKLRVDYGA